MSLYKRLSSLNPGLKEKLRIARYKGGVEEYTKKTFLSSLYLSIGLSIIIFMLLKKPIAFLSFFFLFPLMFQYMLRAVDVKIARISREMSKEIVFATRFLIIELESGITLFEALKGVAENYETIGQYFGEIVDKIELGTPIEQALREAVETTPSNDLRRVLWQILNSISTGGNIADSLRTIIDQIVREKQIMVKEYGRKLSPMAMFYMTATIILPSIGTIMLAILAMFTGIKLTLPVLLVLAGLIVFIQLSFLAMINSSRPPVEI
ncbi:type II secretion system F family protein [Candidatus Woesearchaeota archaeon]|nr:type II secretion system F family protein [Candidatus Woesearchaeota archaeon]